MPLFSKKCFFVGPFRINIRILPTIPKKAWERFAKRFWRPRQTRSWKQVSSWIFYTKFMLPNCKFSCNFFFGVNLSIPHLSPLGKTKKGARVCVFFLVVFVRIKLDMNQSHGSSLSLSCAAVVARRLWMTSRRLMGSEIRRSFGIHIWCVENCDFLVEKN